MDSGTPVLDRALAGGRSPAVPMIRASVSREPVAERAAGLIEELLPPSAGYGELPVGVVTALLGEPVFVFLASRIATGDADVGAAVATARPRRADSYLVALTACVSGTSR